GVGKSARRHATVSSRARAKLALQDRLRSGASAAHRDRARRRLPIRKRSVSVHGDAAPRRGVRRREWVAWFAVLAVVTAAMLSIRGHLNEAHVTLAYLLVVQGG